MKKLTLLCLALSLAAFNSLADETPDGPTISGETDIAVSGEGVTSASIGKDTVAAQEVGTIDSGSLDGATNIEIEAAGDTDAAIGDGSCAEQKIGSIGGQDNCD
ncbi:MAG: hypothetical protein AAF197_06220 [Pseudomonadota bacterium]